MKENERGAQRIPIQPGTDVPGTKVPGCASEEMGE